MPNVTPRFANLPPTTPRHDASLSPQELAEHRQKIASDVEIVLSAYFQPTESQAVRAGQLAWWCDELQEWSREQIIFALRKWNRDEPRRRPTPGDISNLLKQIRGRKFADQMRKEPPPPPPQSERISPERASEIMKEFGFHVRKFGE